MMMMGEGPGAHAELTWEKGLLSLSLSVTGPDRPRGGLPPGPSTSDPPFMHELMQALILERSRKTIHMQLPCFMGLKGTVVAEVATRCDEFGFLY